MPRSTSCRRIFGWLGGVTRRSPVTAPAIWRFWKCRGDFKRAAHLAHVDAILESVLAQQNARQIIRNRAEPRDPEDFALEVLYTVDLRLHEQPMIRTIGRAADGNDRRAVQNRIDHRVAGAAAALQVAADQRLHHHRPGGNKNDIGGNAVFVERPAILRHPDSGRHGADGRIGEDDFLRFRGKAARDDDTTEYRESKDQIFRQPFHLARLRTSTINRNYPNRRQESAPLRFSRCILRIDTCSRAGRARAWSWAVSQDRALRLVRK